MFGAYVYSELTNPLTTSICLMGRSRICLMVQGTRFQVQALKPCKFVQETSEKVLDFKARQLASIEV